MNARFGQQNSISRVWAPTGSSTCNHYTSAKQFGNMFMSLERYALSKIEQLTIAYLPHADSKGLTMHLEENIQSIRVQVIMTVVVMDRAGFHMAHTIWARKFEGI